mmetsp:Transcript_34684/g.80953  ORF Transcript_34684/g.80953 Transcript_34684/m.80953 type:complete len:244 (+) Transcript_34684:405-1136(+)
MQHALGAFHDLIIVLELPKQFLKCFCCEIEVQDRICWQVMLPNELVGRQEGQRLLLHLARPHGEQQPLAKLAYCLLHGRMSTIHLRHKCQDFNSAEALTLTGRLRQLLVCLQPLLLGIRESWVVSASCGKVVHCLGKTALGTEAASASEERLHTLVIHLQSCCRRLQSLLMSATLFLAHCEVRQHAKALAAKCGLRLQIAEQLLVAGLRLLQFACLKQGFRIVTFARDIVQGALQSLLRTRSQ